MIIMNDKYLKGYVVAYLTLLSKHSFGESEGICNLPVDVGLIGSTP
jgi:hypothetical protein